MLLITCGLYEYIICPFLGNKLQALALSGELCFWGLYFVSFAGKDACIEGGCNHFGVNIHACTRCSSLEIFKHSLFTHFLC